MSTSRSDSQPVAADQVWRFKPNRGIRSSRFLVERVDLEADRIHLLYGAQHGHRKTISLRTLKGDYERVS